MSTQTELVKAGKWLIQQALGWAAAKTLDEAWHPLQAPPPSRAVPADRLAGHGRRPQHLPARSQRLVLLGLAATPVGLGAVPARGVHPHDELLRRRPGKLYSFRRAPWMELPVFIA